MKHTIKLDKGKYIQLDSYNVRPKTHRLESFFVGFLFFGFGALTVGAMFGSDVTKNIPPHTPFIKTVTGY
jgi:hypothetical protein